MGDTIGTITGDTPPANPGQPDPNAFDPAVRAQLTAAQKQVDEKNRLNSFESQFNAISNQERDARAAFQKAQDQQAQINAQAATGIGGAGSVDLQALQNNLNNLTSQKGALSFSTQDPTVNQDYQNYLNDSSVQTNSLLGTQISGQRQNQQYEDYINSANALLNDKNKKQASQENAAIQMKKDAALASSSGISVDPYAIKKKPLNQSVLNSNTLNPESVNTNQTQLQSNRI